MDGLREGLQNRFPLTWSDRTSKVTKITGWTITASEPRANPEMASAILDFWTYDMDATAKHLQRGEPGLQPNLFERPVLKFGATLVQLPWIVGLQNSSSAAINNLRRLGARRGHARDEAMRIEAGLARLLEMRGFTTLLNWRPPPGVDDPGEVDIIATLGQHLLVIEVKSTYVRRSQREAWLHATSTLRKAGDQLRRKVEAVSLPWPYRRHIHRVRPPAVRWLFKSFSRRAADCDSRRSSPPERPGRPACRELRRGRAPCSRYR
jgi:Holliday junction resolvase-like predicted endonuclease